MFRVGRVVRCFVAVAAGALEAERLARHRGCFVEEGGSKSTQVRGAEVPPLHVVAHNLLGLSVEDDVGGIGNCDAAGGRGNFVCYRLAIVLVMILR